MPDIILSDFLIWITVITLMLGIGVGAIAGAQISPIGQSAVFTILISIPSLVLDEAASDSFRQGCEAYRSKQYRQAIDHFSQVIQLEPNCAEAYHNRGLTLANLGNDGAAAQDLVSAEHFYDQQGQIHGIQVIKENLNQLKPRQQARLRSE